MKVLIAALLLLSACAPTIEINKVGNEYVQHSYSRNAWHPNWDRVKFCDSLASNGFCPGGETHTAIAKESFGQGAAKGFIASAPIGIGLGLMRFNQTFTNNNVGFKDPHISTANFDAKYVPIDLTK